MTPAVGETVWVRARSVIPGRQRWDVPLCLDRPRIAELIETALRQCPGIGEVRANPVTGRVLVFHNASLDADEVAVLVRQSAARAAAQPERTPSLAPTSARGFVVTRVRKRLRTSVVLALLAGGAVAVGLAGSVLRSPMVRLAVVLGATVIIIRRAWRRSAQKRSASDDQTAIRRPVLAMVGSHRPALYLTTVLSVVAQLMYLAPVLLIGVLMGVLTAGPSAFLGGLGLATSLGQMTFLAAAAAAAAAGFTVVSYVATMKWRRLAQSVQHEWRTEMYSRVQRAELGFLEGERTTRLARVLTDDIDQFGRFLSGSAHYLVRVTTTLAVLIPLFVLGAPTVAWIALLPVPIIAWLSFYYQERITDGFAAAGENGSLLNSQLINNLEASATVKSFGAEDFEVDRIRQLSASYRDSNLNNDRSTTAYGQAVIACALGCLLATFLAGGIEVLAGTMTYEAYNTIVLLPPMLTFQLPGLGEAVEQYQRMVGALARVMDLRELPAERDGSGRALDVLAIEGEMTLDGVTFAYPGRPPILRDVSLRFKARKTTGIVGVTGAGKTTIAKLLLRFQDVESGHVRLDGVDVRDLSLHDLRAAIGFVGQEAFLFDGTIRDNVAYGTFDADDERVAAATRLAEADGFIDALPERYQTPVGERGVTLSGGQRQRISLARAIVKSAPILILDEATSAVDNETEAAIQHALGDFAQARTMVIIAHRLSTIRHADWIYVIGDGGTVLEEGIHDELLARNGVYATLWRLQVGEAT